MDRFGKWLDDHLWVVGIIFITVFLLSALLEGWGR